MMLLIPDFFFLFSEEKKLISLKTPKIPENSWILGEVETLSLFHIPVHV